MQLPGLTPARVVALLPPALILAVLVGVESLLSVVVADRLTGTRHRPTAESLSQGAANIATALFGGLPATGAIARTATNIRAGGQTPVAGIVHAFGFLAVLSLAAPLVGYLAMPSLAGLLVLTAWTMSAPQRWPDYLAARPSDRLLLLVTLVLTRLINLSQAIGTGVALGLAIRMKPRNVPPTDWETPDR